MPGEEAALPDLRYDERVRCAFVKETDETTASRAISGEVRAFTRPDLSRTVDSVLRTISAVSALSEAVLEARVIRICSPAVTPVAVLEALSMDLRDAGFPVAFGRSWSTASNAEAAVGTRGAEPDLVDFLRGHPSWEILA